MERECMEFDVLIVGAGPAGLAAAIRLAQRARSAGRQHSVCVLEKAPEPGAHTLSGAVMDPRGLDALLPGWRERAPAVTPAVEDEFLFLGERSARRVPHALLPGCFRNDGNVIVRLGHLVRWLADEAEALGVEIYPGFAATDIVYSEDGAVRGILTGDMGLTRDGSPGPNHAPGMELRARYTLFAEGCRGHLGKRLETRFGLREGTDPQTYGIGLKELWEVRPEHHRPGRVTHTAGWPLEPDTYGGGFLYHLDGGLVSTGFVVGLDYANPWLSPFREFQRFKTHPALRPLFEGGRRVAYGARAITAGGLQSLPKTTFPGGALIGDDAGYLNAARFKGIHAAIESGMLAADAAFDAVGDNRSSDELKAYTEAFKASPLHAELHRTRNFKPLMKLGLRAGALAFGIDQFVLRGRAPWTLPNRADHPCLREAQSCPRIDYPAPDGEVSFDLLSSVFLSNTNHAEDQPCHLRLRDPEVAIHTNLAHYAAPEQRYCPAGVYEIVGEGETARLQINAQNCVHCKTCDIKDPTQNIEWVPPQGGEGPIYSGM
ncbi:MAG: electron transfer flavoprotein-ubiquinone oxidoreductase [Zoogloeaceae bacterium]|nr:electron transfer flavoprotein-ubiquinone oxidoreductase [Zoogloeaceae bacterium]